METLWTIILRRRASGDYDVLIKGGNHGLPCGNFEQARGLAPNAQQAYQNAEQQLLVKPAFFDPVEKGS